MDAPLWLSLTLACTLACAATLGGSFWWFGRRLATLNHKLDKLDKARQFAGQQTAQARKQIEKLQAELVTQQRKLSQAHVTKQRTEQLDLVLGAADKAAAAPVASAPTERPAHGFADTLPMADAGIP
jgi:uncharacterized protein HemX